MTATPGPASDDLLTPVTSGKNESSSTTGRLRRRPLRAWASTAVGLGFVIVVVSRWSTVRRGAEQLAGADRGWLAVAALATVMTWVCAAVALQGAVVQRLPAGRLMAAQFAASAANHVLPAGLGAGVVNWRFLTWCGLTPAGTATALGLKAAVTVTARAVLMASLAAATPGVLHLPRLPAGVPVLLFALVAGAIVPLIRPMRTRIGGAVAEVRSVHRVPARVAALWGGSFAFALLHALIVCAVTRSLALPLPVVQVALLYLAASGAAALLPTPGGFGSLDAALALALVSAGLPGSAAASVVLGYRLLTVWLPLAPGLLVLALLVHRKML